MAFEFRDETINDYLTRGYVVFRGVIPATLLRDLRREADKARDLAHRVNGPQAQRIQPLEKYADDIDLTPYREYCGLPAIADAIERLFGERRTFGHTHIMGLLIEPAERPWHIGWHRDGPVEVPEEAYDQQLQAVLARVWHDLQYFNQINCALYNDSCTWYVPGSHLRQRDLPGEVRTAGRPDRLPTVEGLSNAEAERLYFEHSASFPGAQQVHLQAGDFMLYRNLAWHCGNYIPYQPRATIHDVVLWPEGGDFQWQNAKKAAIERMKQRQAEAAANATTE